MTFAWLALASIFFLPAVAAADVLASEIRLGDHEARVLIRSTAGAIQVDAVPAVAVGGAAPGADAPAFAPTPRFVEAPYAWRGLDGVVELVLRRDFPSEVDVFLDDGAEGAWVVWPAAEEARRTPAGPPMLALALAALSSRVVHGSPRGRVWRCGMK